MSAFFAARPDAVSPTWIVPPAALATMSAEDLNVPRSYRGYPIVVSPAAGANLILVDAAAVAMADGGVQLDVSNQAAVQMTDTPDTPPVIMVSLWQTNCAAVRVERVINWTTDANAVQYTELS
jgi:hypothetical protein